jgi:hypothetical protein
LLAFDFSRVRIYADDYAAASEASHGLPRGLRRSITSYPSAAHDGARLLEGALRGMAREVPYRAAMESSFGEDFSTVRAFTGQRPALDRLGAGAAAASETVAFASQRPSMWRVAHELAHVVQQRRQDSPNGVTLAARDAPSERDAERAASVAASGGRARVSAAPGGALALSPKNPFDDPKAWSSAAEAAKAMTAYQALPEADRRAAVAASYKTDLIRVLINLSASDRVKTFVDPLREIGRWVEELETRASSGMSDDQIAAEQAKFFIKRAADDAKVAADAAAKAKGVASAPPTPAEIEKARKDAVSATSIAKTTTTWWGGLSAADKTSWTTRGNAAIDAVVKHATAKHPELGITKASFDLDFPGIEARGARVVAAGNPAKVGKAFVTSVELNPAYVMDVVVHEVYGHPEYGSYGSEYHLALYDLASTKVPGYVKPAAGSSARTTEIDAYAYQETEIYAVLRSMSYRTSPTAADAPKVPNLDTQALVNWHVKLMKEQWAPTLIGAILRGLRRRLLIDPRISGAALTVFDKAVETNFNAKTRAAVAA